MDFYERQDAQEAAERREAQEVQHRRMMGQDPEWEAFKARVLGLYRDPYGDRVAVIGVSWWGDGLMPAPQGACLVIGCPHNRWGSIVDLEWHLREDHGMGPLGVACPVEWCLAPVGEACREPLNNPSAEGVHDARDAAWWFAAFAARGWRP